MLLLVALALTLTASIATYALRRGRSPLWWGGASVAITVSGTLLARATVQSLGGTDLVFSAHGGGLVMLSTLIAPVVAIVGNSMLAGRLATLPSVRRSTGTSWIMWRVAEGDEEGCRCKLSAGADAIVATRGGDQLFSIPYPQLAAVDIDGETLLLRRGEGLPSIRLLLTDGDPNDRNARIDELTGIKQTIERLAQTR
jgi:hypothetical protein